MISTEPIDFTARFDTVMTTNRWATGMKASLVGAMCARRGNPEAAVAHLEAAVELIRATDQLMTEPLALLWLAEARLSSRTPAAALEALAAAEAICESGMRYGEPELHRLRAEILARLGADSTAIDDSFRRAVDVARAQQSVSLELRALTSRSRWLMEARRDARVALADLRAVCDRLIQGSETRDRIAARAVLDAHPPAPA